MKIKLTESLKEINGETMTISKEDKTPLTLGKALSSILNIPRERGNGSLDKMKSFILAVDCYSKDEIDLDEADFEKLKEVCKTDPYFAPSLSGQAHKMLLRFGPKKESDTDKK